MAKWNEIFAPGAKQYTFDKVTLEAIFAAHEADELRGLGSLTAREELISEILKQHNIVMAQRTGVAPMKPAPAYKDNTISLTSAQAVKAASITKTAMG